MRKFELFLGYDDVDFEEDAKWANLLSDTSDFEE
jgi:hypothetical protein